MDDEHGLAVANLDDAEVLVDSFDVEPNFEGSIFVEASKKPSDLSLCIFPGAQVQEGGRGVGRVKVIHGGVR